MTPTNRLDSVPPNVLHGASIPNSLATLGLRAPTAPSGRVLRVSIAGMALIGAMLALLVALLVPILGGRVP